MSAARKLGSKILHVVQSESAPARRRSVRQVAKAHRRGDGPKVFSTWCTEIRGRDGRLKFRAEHHNLTTDTASGYTNRRDWQAKAMGGGLAPTATMTGNATATSATSLTNSGASFPTTNQGLAGMIVVAGPNSAGVGATSFGVVVSNTSTVLTIDKWYSGGTWGTGTTPNATAAYTIVPGQMPAMFIGVSSDSGAPAATDTTLASESTTNGFTRTLATWAHTAGASTYTMSVTFTATGSFTLNKWALFGAANTTAGGAMPFEAAETSPPSMLSGDTVTQTVTITIG